MFKKKKKKGCLKTSKQTKKPQKTEKLGRQENEGVFMTYLQVKEQPEISVRESKYIYLPEIQR